LRSPKTLPLHGLPVGRPAPAALAAFPRGARDRPQRPAGYESDVSSVRKEESSFSCVVTGPSRRTAWQ